MTDSRVFLFDLGNVLVEWDPAPLFEKRIPDPGLRARFLECFLIENAAADRSSWQKALPSLAKKYPAYADFFSAYPENYKESLGAVLEGTVEIVRDLKKAGYKVYAASNWAADTFEQAKEALPFLSLFDGLQISGQVGLIKPDPAFFYDMMDRFDFKAENAVFIDDLARNVKAAAALGIDAILFSSPQQIRQEFFRREICLTST